MAFSPFKGPFVDRVTKWEAQLSLASEILDAWLAVQRSWMYLEPILTSPDIMQQLPLEGKRFATVDRTWRKLQDAARRAPQVLQACSSPKLLTSLLDCNKMLELVQKGLVTYLEAKQLAFARCGAPLRSLARAFRPNRAGHGAPQAGRRWLRGAHARPRASLPEEVQVLLPVE